jgi:hypothetical protein
VAAPPGERPTYLSADLAGLSTPQPEVSLVEGAATCGGWTASAPQGRLSVAGAGSADDWWRAVAQAAWAHADATGQHVDAAGAVPPR